MNIKGTSGCVMVRLTNLHKWDWFSLMLHSYGLVPHLSKALSKLLLWTSIDLIKEDGFTLKRKASSRWYLAEIMMDADFTDDLALIASTPVPD